MTQEEVKAAVRTLLRASVPTTDSGRSDPRTRLALALHVLGFRMDTIESALGLTRPKLVRWLDRAERKGFPRRGRDAMLRLMAKASIDLGEVLAPFGLSAGARRHLAAELESHAPATPSLPVRPPAAIKALALAAIALVPACNEPVPPGGASESSTEGTTEGTTATGSATESASEPTTGGASSNELVIPDGVYCALSSEFNDSFAELRQRRLKLHLAAARYPLPPSSEYDEHKTALSVPFTLETAEGMLEWPEDVAPGEVYISRGYDLFDLDPKRMAMFFGQDVPAPAGAPALFGDSWSWALQVTHEASEPIEFTLGAPDSTTAQFERRIRISPVADFGSCTFPEAGWSWRTTVTLADGEVMLDARSGPSMIVESPVQLVRASGSFRGQEFEQTDYFNLLYRPYGLDASNPSFAFTFPAPIDGVCGLAFEYLGYDELPPLESRAWTIDCDFNLGDPLEITALNEEFVDDP